VVSSGPWREISWLRSRDAPKLSNNFCIGPAESIFIKGQSPRPFNLLIFFIWKLKDVKEEKEEGLKNMRGTIRKDI
jgi:hypothetical protein